MTGTEALATTVLRLRPDRTEPLEALIGGAGPHLVEILDVGSAANGDLVVVLPSPAVRLPELLVAPGGLTAGEAVTVLVPLAQALHRLHVAGVAHGGVGASAVVVDADGCPAWSAPDAPALLRRAGAATFAERVAADVEAFRALCAAVLRPAGVAVPPADSLEGLAAALYGLASAEPVRLQRQSEPLSTQPWSAATPARLVPAIPVVAGMPVASAAMRLRRTLLLQARGVRPRVWIALAAAVALLIGALALLSSGDDGRSASAMPHVATSPTQHRASAAASRSTSVAVAGRSLDAAAAVGALLAERDRCLEAGSESCLRQVDAAGAPVLQADLAAVRAGVAAVRIDRSRLHVSGGGGTALATAGGATVLAVREQHGWLLRDVVAQPSDE